MKTPAPRTAVSSPRRGCPAAVTANGRQPHILIVNDTQEILELMQELLEGEGYHVTTSLALLDVDTSENLAPDVIMQDLLSEYVQQEGRKFRQVVRLDPDPAEIPLLLCTAAVHAIEEPKMASQLERLAGRVAPKPFDIDEMLATVEDALAERGSTRPTNARGDGAMTWD